MYVSGEYWATAESQKSLREGHRFLYTRYSLPSIKVVCSSWILPGAVRRVSAVGWGIKEEKKIIKKGNKLSSKVLFGFQDMGMMKRERVEEDSVPFFFVLDNPNTQESAD